MNMIYLESFFYMVQNVVVTQVVVVNSLYVLIISLWGFTGAEWVYVGNQIVYQEPMTKQECEVMADNWSKYELNEFYRMSIECHEKD